MSGHSEDSQWGSGGRGFKSRRPDNENCPAIRRAFSFRAAALSPSGLRLRLDPAGQIPFYFPQKKTARQTLSAVEPRLVDHFNNANTPTLAHKSRTAAAAIVGADIDTTGFPAAV